LGYKQHILLKDSKDMWLDVVKVLASSSTPIVIAYGGFKINRTIQRQNATAQRESSWLVNWAEDFLKVAADFNGAATSFLMLYWELHHSLPSSNVESANDDSVLHYRDLVRGEWHIVKYVDFAPENGTRLEEATRALVEEVRSWSINKGGSVPIFRQKQIEFNTSVRKVHAELLGL
jgi:hypothetical protein